MKEISGLMRSTLTIMAIVAVGLIARAQNPSTLPNPNEADANAYVSDPSGLLSEHAESELNHQLAALRESTTCEVAVAIVGNLDGMTIEDYSHTLFEHWGVGKSDKNNGVLFVICPSERQSRIEVGSGAEGVLTDIACAKIIRSKVVPAMKDDNLSQAVYGVVSALSTALTDPEAAAELRSSKEDTTVERIKALDGKMFWNFVQVVICCVFIFALAMFVADLVITRRRDNYRRAMAWRSHMNTYWLCALLSLGAAFPIALIAFMLYRRARNVKEICDTCGTPMTKLSEEEDNAYLSPSQDFEEKIGSVDYDVWLCPNCGTVERFPYVERQLKYQKCPDCDTIAMNLVMDKVVDPPTATHEGHGERLYQCQFCRHTRRESYVIPKKTDDSAAAAAVIGGALLGSLGRRSGGGGGDGFGGGGGFGGGHSSGGGASGSW